MFFPIFIGSDARFLIKTSARARNESSEGRETCTSKEKRRRRNAEFEERRTKEKKKKKKKRQTRSTQLGKRRREIFPDRVKRAGLALNQFCVSTNEAWSRWQRWRPPRVLLSFSIVPTVIEHIHPNGERFIRGKKLNCAAMHDDKINLHLLPPRRLIKAVFRRWKTGQATFIVSGSNVYATLIVSPR